MIFCDYASESSFPVSVYQIVFITRKRATYPQTADATDWGILIVRSDAYRFDWNPLLMSSG